MALYLVFSIQEFINMQIGPALSTHCDDMKLCLLLILWIRPNTCSIDINAKTIIMDESSSFDMDSLLLCAPKKFQTRFYRHGPEFM